MRSRCRRPPNATRVCSHPRACGSVRPPHRQGMRSPCRRPPNATRVCSHPRTCGSGALLAARAFPLLAARAAAASELSAQVVRGRGRPYAATRDRSHPRTCGSVRPPHRQGIRSPCRRPPNATRVCSHPRTCGSGALLAARAFPLLAARAAAASELSAQVVRGRGRPYAATRDRSHPQAGLGPLLAARAAAASELSAQVVRGRGRPYAATRDRSHPQAGLGPLLAARAAASAP